MDPVSPSFRHRSVRGTVAAMPKPPRPFRASDATWSRRDRRHSITGTSPAGDDLDVVITISAVSLTAVQVIASAIVAWSTAYVPPPYVQKPGRGGSVCAGRRDWRTRNAR